jgi:tetratricopeptide (TPR) repeat protein
MMSPVKLHTRFVNEQRGLTFFILKVAALGLALGWAPALFSQAPSFDLEHVLRTSSVEGFREEVRAFVAKNKNTPLALYLDALSQTDAAAAVDKYRQLVSQHPNSEYADRALLKTAQYYFSRGLYVAARKQYLELVEQYPNSPYLPESLYFAASCLYASGNQESAANELKNLIRQHADSRFARIAKEDLQESNGLSASAAFKKPAIKMDSPNGKFSLQIGAFTQVNNALNLKNYCLKLGYPAEIREKKDGATMYLVWLGSFATKEEAERFGEIFKKEHGKLYRVVAR